MIRLNEPTIAAALRHLYPAQRCPAARWVIDHFLRFTLGADAIAMHFDGRAVALPIEHDAAGPLLRRIEEAFEDLVLGHLAPMHAGEIGSRAWAESKLEALR